MKNLVSPERNEDRSVALPETATRRANGLSVENPASAIKSQPKKTAAEAKDNPK